MIEVVLRLYLGSGQRTCSLCSVSEIEEGSEADEKNYFPAQPSLVKEINKSHY